MDVWRNASHVLSQAIQRRRFVADKIKCGSVLSLPFQQDRHVPRAAMVDPCSTHCLPVRPTSHPAFDQVIGESGLISGASSMQRLCTSSTKEPREARFTGGSQYRNPLRPQTQHSAAKSLDELASSMAQYPVVVTPTYPQNYRQTCGFIHNATT